MAIDFEIYVDDTRYEVPSLYLVSASNELRARAIASGMLHGCDHHRGVELRRDGEAVFALGSFAALAAAACKDVEAAPV
jgi:hypothetical protein